MKLIFHACVLSNDRVYFKTFVFYFACYGYKHLYVY